MQVVIKPSTKFGLEVFQCFVNNTLVTEFMSVQGARTWAQTFITKHHD